MLRVRLPVEERRHCASTLRTSFRAGAAAPASPSVLPDMRSACVRSERVTRGWAPLAEGRRAYATFRHRRGTVRRVPYAREQMPYRLPTGGARSSRRGFARIDRRSLQNSFLASSRRYGFRAGKVFEDRAQFAQRAMDADFHSPDFAVEQARDLFILEFLKAAQHEHLALVVRQHKQCFVQQRRLLLALGRVVRHHRRQHLRLEFERFRMFANVIEPGVARDLIHPRTERSARLVALTVFENAKEDVLHQVLAHSAITGKAAVEVE